jgi:signal transduction histidine kinase
MNTSPDNTAPNSSDEEVLLVVHKHWVGFIPDALFAVLPGLILFIFWRLPEESVGSILHTMFTLFLPLGAMIVWILLAMLWTNYFLDMLILTDRRIFYTSQINLSNRTIEEWDIQDIQHVNVEMGNVLESFFNYGTLGLETKGTGEVILLDDIPNPEYVSAIILKQDDRFGELKESARKQGELLRFVSHEVKGHLTKSKAAFAAIVEGDYGPVSEPLGSMAHQALADSQKGVDTVMSILENTGASGPGGVAMVKKPFDLSVTVRHAAQDFRPAAQEKGITLHESVDDFCVVNGDEEKLARHVLRNLIDNAIRYTHAGHIEVGLKKVGATVRFSVLDTGVGIGANDMRKLFTEGGHGERSKDVNVESTGYGLFIAKKIVDAHGGRIWAQSRGPGTGSTFFVELPLGVA